MPLMTPETQTGARFTLNQSAFRFSNLSGGGIAPQVEIASALKDLKENYEQFETTIVENTKR